MKDEEGTRFSYLEDLNRKHPSLIASIKKKSTIYLFSCVFSFWVFISL